MQSKPYYLPDEDPPRRSLRERWNDLRKSLGRGWSDASAGLRQEWRNLTRSHPWLQRYRFVLLSGVVLVALLVPALVWFALNLRRSTEMPTALQFRPLLEAPGEKLHAALSADGRKVAFVWDGGQTGGNYDIYIAGTAPEDRGKPPEHVTSNPANDLRPAWSPDGSRLAFLRATDEKIQLILLLLADKQELPMIAIEPRGWYHFKLDPQMRMIRPGPEWSADGDAVYITDGQNADIGVPLWRVDAATNEREQLTHPSEGKVDAYPLRVRSGRDLMFVRRSDNHSGEAFRIETSLGRELQMTASGSDVRGAVLTPNGRDLILSSDEGGRPQLRYFAPRSGSTSLIPVPDGHSIEPSWNGSVLTWTSVRTGWSLWELPLESGNPPEGERVLRKLAAPQGRNHGPAFSPDGRTLIWVADANGPWEVWSTLLPGGEPRQLSRLGPQWGSRFLASPAWSPDGRHIAFEARPGGHPSVAITDPAAAAVRSAEDNFYNEVRPSWSQDAKWIYYGSDRDRMWQIWRRQLAGGQATRVTSKEGVQAFESTDGKMLYFAPGVGQTGIWAMNTNGGSEQMLPGTERFSIRGHWAVGPSGIYFIGYEAEPRTLYYYQYATQAAVPVMQLPRDLPADVSAIAVDRAGTRLVLALQDELHSEVMIGRR